MPLAPDAESCAVCGARVPLIARPASGDEEVAPDDGPPHVGGPVGRPPTPVPGTSPGHGAAPVPGPGQVAGGLTGRVPAAAPHVPAGVGVAAPRPTAFDPAAAGREVRAGARPVRPGQPSSAAAVPSIGPRVLAYAVDVVAAAAAAALGLGIDRLTVGAAGVLSGVLPLVVAIAQVVAEGLRGATLGAWLLGLRTVDERTGSVPGIPRAFLRQLVAGLGVVACLVGNWVVVASGAWDSGPRRRGWHDKASGTAVVRAGGQTATSSVRPAGSSPAQPVSAPWTPGAPSADPVRTSAPAAGGAAGLDEFLFAPPAPGVASPGVPPGPAPAVAPAAGSPAPDLLPPAPVPSDGPVPSDASRPPARPEADLLPPPPAVARREHVDARPVVPAAGPLPIDDDLADLEHTRVRDPESLRRRTGTLALHFDTGERVRVVGRGLVGRGPRAEDGQDILHVVALNDAARSLSRVHAEFGPQPAAPDQDTTIWVSDRGSTNGTVVIDPAGTARVLPAGARALVGAGWTVRLGDREARVEDD